LHPEEEDRVYTGQVVEVHSGDDIIAMLDLGHDGLYKRTRIRLSKVDTPDAYREDIGTEAGKVREDVRSLVAGRNCLITVHSIRKSGWICTVDILKGKNSNSTVNLNEHLIGLGYLYKGET